MIRAAQTVAEQEKRDKLQFEAIRPNEARALIRQVERFWPLAGKLRPGGELPLEAGANKP